MSNLMDSALSLMLSQEYTRSSVQRDSWRHKSTQVNVKCGGLWSVTEIFIYWNGGAIEDSSNDY